MVTFLMSHLDPLALAAYLDGRAASHERRTVEAHLATCAECRTEWLAVTDLVPSRPAGRKVWMASLAAAAAVAFLLLVPRPERPAVHREPEVLTAVAPVVLSPAGAVMSARQLEWSRVPGVDRYRVTVFDSAGAVIWQAVATDTIATLPSSITLAPGTPYYLRVHARSGFDRWTESKLVEFRILP